MRRLASSVLVGLLFSCGSRTGLSIEPAATDAAVAPGLDASLAPFPCRWGLGVPVRVGPAEPTFDVVVDETKLALVRTGPVVWGARDGRVAGPWMALEGGLASLSPGGFLFVSTTCEGVRLAPDLDTGVLSFEGVPIVAGERCAVGRGERDDFPLLVVRGGRTSVQRVTRDLAGVASLGEAPLPLERVDAFAVVDEQVYVVSGGALTFVDVRGASRGVSLPGRARDLAVDRVGGGVVVLLEDRAGFVARGVLGREVELPPTFPHLAVSDQEALVLGRDGTLWTLPLSRGPARAVERMPAPDDAQVALAEVHPVGGVASREGGAIVWRALTCNR